MITKKWSKSVYFSMIADSRFTKDIKKEIQNIVGVYFLGVLI